MEIEHKKPFSCFPVCKACTDAGVCERTLKVRSSPPKKVTAKKIEVFEELRNRASWRMPCGHTTDYDVQLLVSVWRPKGKDWFCDKCWKWFKKPPKPKKVEIDVNEQPPF